MRINFYSESPDPGPGGAEQFIAVLAEALSRTHAVCIVHHKPPEAEAAWGGYAGCDLSRVKFRQVAMASDESNLCRTPWARYRAARNWRRALTEDCDLFVALLHNKPPFCHARRGVLVVLFPTYEPFRGLDDPVDKPLVRPKRKKRGAKSIAKKPSPQPGRAGMFEWRWLRRFYTRWEWRRRLATYQVRLSISDFSRRWTKERWEIESDLLYPPVALPQVNDAPRSNRILSVGRFATTGHTKKQAELIQTFAELRTEIPDWSYATVGGLNAMPHDHAFFEKVRQLGEAHSVEVRANISRAELTDLYATSRIFWHGAGLGEDHRAQPEQAEHFGLTTVEAMAAGCVPLVINHGGQPEIVEHGVSGFVWNSLAELKDYTRRLTSDPALLQTMSTAARLRADTFSRKRCVERLLRAAQIENACPT